MTVTTAVIGASGQIGSAVLTALRGEGVRGVTIARSWTRLGNLDDIDAREVSVYSSGELVRVLDSCDRVIVTLGLPYAAQVWMRQWPGLLREVAQATLVTQTPFIVVRGASRAESVSSVDWESERAALLRRPAFRGP